MEERVGREVDCCHVVVVFALCTRKRKEGLAGGGILKRERGRRYLKVKIFLHAADVCCAVAGSIYAEEKPDD